MLLKIFTNVIQNDPQRLLKLTHKRYLKLTHKRYSN